MSSGSSALSATKRADVSDVLADSRARAAARQGQRSQTQAADNRFANIQANPFFKAVTDSALSPVEKRAAIATTWTATGNKENDRATVKAFETFLEYMQATREEMATESIRLNDTETFAELQKVYNELNSALVEFGEQMTPLTDILDAIYKLRTNGLTLDAFKEIQEDKKREAEFNERIIHLNDEDVRLTGDIRNIDNEILALGQKKGFFGFGGIKESARIEIAQKQAQRAEMVTRQEALVTEIDDIERQRHETTSKLGDLAGAKETLRGLLDIRSEEAIDRQKRLVGAALNFVESQKARVGSVRVHLEKMSGSIQSLSDANQDMTGVYALLSEGLNDAETANKAKSDALAPPSGEEDLMSRTEREDAKKNVDLHLKALGGSARKVGKTYADLTEEAINFNTMLSANEAQLDGIVAMHTDGVASVAGRLATVVTAVSTAALNESRGVAKDTMAGMRDLTNKVAQKEAIQVAMGANEIRDDLDKALDNLAAFGEIFQETRTVQEDAVAGVRDNLQRLKSLADNVQTNIRSANSVHADAIGGGSAQAAPTSTPGTFGKFGGLKV